MGPGLSGVLGQDAALWRGGEVTRLSGFVLESMASAINNRRQIVGGSFQLVPGAPGGPGASFAVVAAMWESGKVRQLIPSPEAGWRSQALAINDRAQVVGFMTSGFGTSRLGFLLERGSVLELGPAGRVPTTAHDVSEAGTIVGESGGPVLWTSDPRTVRGGHGPAAVSASRAPEGRGARASRAAPVWAEAVCEDHGGLRGRVLGVEVAAGC